MTDKSVHSGDGSIKWHRCLNCLSGVMFETQYMDDDDPVFWECQACGFKEDE